MLNTLKNLATSAVAVLEKDRCVPSETLKAVFQWQVRDAGLEVSELVCSDNQVAIQIKKPGALFKSTAMLDIVLHTPAVDWPKRSLVFQLRTKTSLEAGLIKRIVGALTLGLMEAVHGEHIVVEKALAGQKGVFLEGSSVRVDLSMLPGYDKLMAVPVIGSQIRLDKVYFRDDGAYVKLGVGA